MKKAHRTRQRILQEGLALASLYGFESLTFGGLAERTNLSKSGLFAHFRSRDELQADVLEQAGLLFQQTVIEPAEREPEGFPRLRTLFHLWIGWTTRSGLPGGCPFIAVAVELDDSESPLRIHAQQWLSKLTGYLSSLVEACSHHQHLPADIDIRQCAQEIYGIYLAYHFASRFMQDPHAEQRAQWSFERLIQHPPLHRKD